MSPSCSGQILSCDSCNGLGSNHCPVAWLELHMCFGENWVGFILSSGI